MALTTFGAIIGFASEIIGKAIRGYHSALDKVADPVLKEVLLGLLEESKKNYSLMEQIRRENVTEMILEPITGLREEDYKIELKLSEPTKDSDLLVMAMALEEKVGQFFNDASRKVPLPEVSRILKKIVQRKEKNLAKLKSFG
jgi:rubrerythrin